AGPQLPHTPRGALHYCAQYVPRSVDCFYIPDADNSQRSAASRTRADRQDHPVDRNAIKKPCLGPCGQKEILLSGEGNFSLVNTSVRNLRVNSRASEVCRVRSPDRI